MDILVRQKLPIEIRLKLLREEEHLIEKHRKSGSKSPITDGMLEFESSKIVKKHIHTSKERKTSTDRVKSWRIRNAQKNKEQNRLSQSRWRRRKLSQNNSKTA